MVPDIVHAKVGPLIQLKFLVRLLRGIRLKSWNRRPIVKKNYQCKPSSENKTPLDEIAKENNVETDCDNVISKSVPQPSNKEILQTVHERIENSHSAKTILDILENRLDPEQILNIKEQLYICMIKKLTAKRGLHTKTDRVSHISMDSSSMSFADGMIQLIIEEVLAPEITDDPSSISSSNSCGSFCSNTVKNIVTDSQSTTKGSGDIIEKCNQILLKKDPKSAVNSDRVLKEAAKSYSASINLTKRLNCNGDDFLEQNARISQIKVT